MAKHLFSNSSSWIYEKLVNKNGNTTPIGFEILAISS